MFRRVIATFLVAATLIPTGAAAAGNTAHTRAAVWPAVRQQGLTHLIATLAKPGSLGGRELAPMVAPAEHSSAHAPEGVSTLRVPDAAFSPATINPQYDGAESNAQADMSDFTVFHSASYSSMGRVTGYLERGDWTPSGASGPAYFYYQVSTFGSAAAGDSAYQNGVTHVKSLTSEDPTDCTKDLKTECSIFGYTRTDGTDGVYTAFRVNECLSEVDASAPDSVFKAQEQQVAKTAAAVIAAAFAAASSACTGAPAGGPAPVPSKNTVSYKAPSNLWPTGAQLAKDYVPTNTDDLLKLFHPTTSLTTLGRTVDEGYVEGVVWTGTTKQTSKCGKKKCTKKVKFTVTLAYIVSVFPTAAQATAALSDGKQQFAGMKDSSTALPTSLGDQMYAYMAAGSQDAAGVLAFQRGRVTVEMMAVSKKAFTKQLAQGMVYLDSVGQWLDGQARQQS